MIVISGENLNGLIEKLKKDFDFFDASLQSIRPSFKKFFFLPTEEIFATKVKPLFYKGLTFVANKPPKKFILYGLNLPQLEALAQMDEIMSKPNVDPFYFEKRKQSFVIGIIKEKIDAAPGGDLILEDKGDNQYRILANTLKGKNLVKNYNKFFQTIDDEKEKIPQIPGGSSLNEWSKSMRQLLLDPEFLANAVEWSHDHKIWDELAEKCLGCGVCTYVCPICHCFSIEDRVGLTGDCSRCRKWDACTLPEFSEIAGGHNFRPTIKERYYNWFYHKFVRAYKEYGKSQCVGCGACKHNCPAQIDIQEILKEILKNYKKNNG